MDTGGVNTLLVFVDSLYMSDVEIIGRPKYPPTKLIDRTEQSRTEKRIRNQSEFNREMKIHPIDIVYERDENEIYF